MICPYCGDYAKWCSSEEIYGRRYGKSYMCYYCKKCDAYVGCHNNSKKALGTLANVGLREWRKKAHKRFDPLWRRGKNKQNRRSKAYIWLSEQLGVPSVHIGEANTETCQKIIEACNKFYKPKTK